MKPRTKTVLRFAAIFLVGLLVGAGYVQSQAPSGTFYISQGVYPGAPSYTVWKEGSTYFAKNAYGRIDFSSINASQVFSDIVNVGLPKATTYTWEGNRLQDAPYGSIYFKAGRYSISSLLGIIPNGAVLTITGDGSTYQAGVSTISDGMQGGTQIYSTSTAGILIVNPNGTYYDTTPYTNLPATKLIMRDIEFYQDAQMTTSSMTSALWLDGMSNGEFENVVVTSYRGQDDYLDGYGIYADTHTKGDRVAFINVQSFGFNNPMCLGFDHFSGIGLGVGDSYDYLKILAVPFMSIRDLHMYGIRKGIAILPSAGTAADLTIENLYIEGVNGAVDPFWYEGVDSKERVIINKVWVGGVDSSKNVWTCNAGAWAHFEFHNVMSDGSDYTGTPLFSNVTAPAMPASAADCIQNVYPFVIQVQFSANGASISNLQLNDVSICPGGDYAHFFLFRPGDKFVATYSSATPTWAWAAYDAQGEGYL
jgi:hypothetical protein